MVALIVTSDGTKVPVGLRLGDTENATVVKALLADLVDRGLDATGGLLVVIDGATALASAVGSVFGDLALVQRCQLHKRRNVADHLPKAQREAVDARLRGAFADPDPAAGLRKAKALAAELERTHPTLQPACAKASTRCSPSAGSASTAPSLARWCART